MRSLAGCCPTPPPPGGGGGGVCGGGGQRNGSGTGVDQGRATKTTMGARQGSVGAAGAGAGAGVRRAALSAEHATALLLPSVRRRTVGGISARRVAGSRRADPGAGAPLDARRRAGAQRFAGASRPRSRPCRPGAPLRPLCGAETSTVSAPSTGRSCGTGLRRPHHHHHTSDQTGPTRSKTPPAPPRRLFCILSAPPPHPTSPTQQATATLLPADAPAVPGPKPGPGAEAACQAWLRGGCGGPSGGGRRSAARRPFCSALLLSTYPCPISLRLSPPIRAPRVQKEHGLCLLRGVRSAAQPGSSVSVAGKKGLGQHPREAGAGGSGLSPFVRQSCCNFIEL